MINTKFLVTGKEDCAFCGRRITEPICDKCLLYELLILKNEIMLSKYRRLIINSLRDIEFLENRSICRVCGKREVIICPSCFYSEFGDKLFPLKIDSHSLLILQAHNL